MSGMPDRPDRSIPPPSTEKSVELPDRAAFERVLRETLGQADPFAHEEAARVEVLLELVRRHRGEPFRTEPMAQQLVGLLLKTQFPNLTAAPEFWDHVSIEIATTLMEDPHQEALLRRFWTSLCDRAA